jgi:signal transduction histidine kinase/DNA-binding NarL/FixJ family response regulator
LPDIGLAILLPVLRFSLGWYLARFFALTACSVLLVVLLAETMALYARLARTVVLQQRYRTKLEAMTADLIAARDAAELANRAKSEFLARMSHELRTPMTCVLGMADLLVESNLTAQQRRHATLLRDAGQSLLAIIDDLLDIAKIEAGKLELERVPFSTSAVAQSAVDIVSSAAATKGLALRTELASDLPPWIAGDPTRVRQILLNLLSNAVKFTKRGSVVLRVSRAPGAEISQLRFEVVDTGIGIDIAHQHLLFQRFSRVGRACDRQFGGTGLGLAISRYLVDAMGGTFGVDSRLDAGSTFYFALPFVEAEAQAAVQEKPSTVDAGSCARILVAEDHDIVRETIEAMLTSAGHEVVSARNGAEAITSLTMRDFDLVLMDVQMPELDGIAAIERIRKMDERIRNIPIIALTAYAMPEDAERCRAAGANDHLPKPFDRSDMLRLVATWSASGHDGAAPSRIEVATPHAIDTAVLDRLEGRIGKARVTKFVDLFCDQLEKALSAIAATSDHQRMAAETHELLSIAGILGCVELSKWGCALMDAARRASIAVRERYRS